MDGRPRPPSTRMPISDIGCALRQWLCCRFQPLSKYSFEPIQCCRLSLGEDMRRREFITLLGGAAAGWPLAARAQQVMPVIGFLGNTSGDKTSLASFRQGLEQIGYIEGRNIAVEYHWTEGQYDRAAALAADLVGRQVAVLVAISLPLALAVKAATATIPIVFLMGDDPVKFGLVASLSRPGANITGFSFLAPIEAKRLELLHELVPKASILAALVNPKFSSAEVRVTAVRDAATALGLQLTVYNASSESEIDMAFASVAERQTGAFLSPQTRFSMASATKS